MFVDPDGADSDASDVTDYGTQAVEGKSWLENMPDFLMALFGGSALLTAGSQSPTLDRRLSRYSGEVTQENMTALTEDVNMTTVAAEVGHAATTASIHLAMGAANTAKSCFMAVAAPASAPTLTRRNWAIKPEVSYNLTPQIEAQVIEKAVHIPGSASHWLTPATRAGLDIYNIVQMGSAYEPLVN